MIQCIELCGGPGIIWTGDLGPSWYWSFLLACYVVWLVGLFAPVAALIVGLIRAGGSGWLRVLSHACFPTLLGPLFALLASFEAAQLANEWDFGELTWPLAAPLAALLVGGLFSTSVVLRTNRALREAEQAAGS